MVGSGTEILMQAKALVLAPSIRLNYLPLGYFVGHSMVLWRRESWADREDRDESWGMYLWIMEYDNISLLQSCFLFRWKVSSSQSTKG